jgi:hypothetical protein
MEANFASVEMFIFKKYVDFNGNNIKRRILKKGWNTK